MKSAVIVSAVRTPLGSFGGSLAKFGATDLGGELFIIFLSLPWK